MFYCVVHIKRIHILCSKKHVTSTVYSILKTSNYIPYNVSSTQYNTILHCTLRYHAMLCYDRLYQAMLDYTMQALLAFALLDNYAKAIRCCALL